MRKVITALLSIILVGCFSSSYDDYLGYWKKEGAGLTILEIKKEGSNYFVTPNVIDPFMSKSIPLEGDDGKLIMKRGSKVKTITLNAERNEISADNEVFKKISADELITIQSNRNK